MVEIKDDGEMKDPSDENRKKFEFAVAHFKRLNEYMEEEGLPIRYHFNFLTQSNFGTYFQ